MLQELATSVILSLLIISRTTQTIWGVEGVVQEGINFPSLTNVVTSEYAESILNTDEGKMNVLFVSAEVIGPTRNGGIGMALTSLAYSLVRQGHAVTILFTEGTIPGYNDIYEQWVQYYRDQGIELIGLFQRWDTAFPRALVQSFEVTYFLQKRKFDIIHCHDYMGACYFSMMKKEQGDEMLSNTSFILGLHGPTMWAKKVGNQEKIRDIVDLETDFMEKKCLQLADYVIR